MEIFREGEWRTFAVEVTFLTLSLGVVSVMSSCCWGVGGSVARWCGGLGGSVMARLVHSRLALQTILDALGNVGEVCACLVGVVSWVSTIPVYRSFTDTKISVPSPNALSLECGFVYWGLYHPATDTGSGIACTYTPHRYWDHPQPKITLEQLTLESGGCCNVWSCGADPCYLRCVLRRLGGTYSQSVSGM